MIRLIYNEEDQIFRLQEEGREETYLPAYFVKSILVSYSTDIFFDHEKKTWKALAPIQVVLYLVDGVRFNGMTRIEGELHSER